MLATAKGGSFLAFGSLFAYASRFVIAFLLARLLGVEQFGMYTLAISAATIISNFSTLGLDSTMVRYIAIQARKNDEDAIWGTIQIGLGFSFLVSVLLSIGLFFLSEPIAVQIFHEPQLASFLELFSLFIPFSTASFVLIDIARGFKRMDYSALGDNVILFVTRFCLIGILFLINLNAYTAILAYGIADVVVAFSLVFLLNKEFSFKRPLRQSQRNYREILIFAFPFWFSALLRKVRGNLQTLLLGSLSTVSNVGIFTVVNKTTLIGHLVYKSILGSVKPILAELQDQENWEQMGHLYKTTTRWAFLANLPLFLIMLLYPESLLAIFGKGFTGGALALTVFAFAELVNAATGICGSIIDMTGQTKLKFVNSIISTTLVVSGNVFLIPRWGVLGTAVASFTAVSFLNIIRVIQVWYLYTYVQFQTFVNDPDGIQNQVWFQGLHDDSHLHQLAEQRFQYANHPRDTVNWYNALAFCRWYSWRLGGGYNLDKINEWKVRLPTEYEWEKAARGVDGRIYPYGNEFIARMYSINGTHKRHTNAVGMLPEGKSPYDVLDMVGNVWEWCVTDFDNPKVNASDENLHSGNRRVLRGGGWFNFDSYAHASFRNHGYPNLHNYFTGFRLCTSP